MGRVRRVAVVDDDEWSRAGVVQLLAGTPDLEVIADLDHTGAMTSDAWLDASVLLVDAADESRADDQFPGVDVVRRARERGRPDLVVVVVTGHFWAGAARRRMAEAGADLFHYRPDVTTAADLRAILRSAERGRAAVPDPEDPEQLFRLGVSGSTRVNDLVDAARSLGWDPVSGAAPGDRSRRGERDRRRLAEAGRVHVVNRDGTPPDRDQSTPGRPQLVRLLRWATRVPEPRR